MGFEVKWFEGFEVKYMVWTVAVLSLVLAVWLLVYLPAGVGGDLQWEKKDADFWRFQRHDNRLWLEDAQQYCRQLELDGHYDWRLPTVKELEGLLQLSVGKRKNLAGIDRSIYWSATPCDAGQHRFLAFSFATGRAAPMTRHNYNSVVCVR